MQYPAILAILEQSSSEPCPQPAITQETTTMGLSVRCIFCSFSVLYNFDDL